MKAFAGDGIMAKKILIHTRKLTIPGGKQTFLKALEPHFDGDVTYFYYGSRTNAKESWIVFLKRFLGDFILFNKVVKKGNFDLVHINTSFNRNSFYRDSIFTWLSKINKAKTLVFWHGWRWDFEQHAYRWLKLFFHLTFARADAMICLSNEFKHCLKKYRYHKPIFVATTVVEDQVFKIPKAFRANELKEDAIRLLFLGRIEKTKGIYETIEAFKSIKKTFPNAQLQIAGTGRELEAITEFVSAMKENDITLSGWLEGKAKIHSLHQSDIFILASHSEGMPIGVLEAMAAAKPVITTQVGGVTDFFEEGKMGFLVEPGDVSQLAEKIEKLIKQPQLRTEMGAFNRKYAKSHFTAEHVCKKIERIYQEISSEKRTN